MASADEFDITIHGKGGHAALPNLTIDPIVVGAHVLSVLQTLVSRRTDPLDSTVISICQFHAGTAYNVIPDKAVLKGTLRCLNEKQ